MHFELIFSKTNFFLFSWNNSSSFIYLVVKTYFFVIHVKLWLIESISLRISVGWVHMNAMNNYAVIILCFLFCWVTGLSVSFGTGFASFVHRLFSRVKGFFPIKVMLFLVIFLKKKVKEVILQVFARTLKDLLKRCIVFKRISKDSCKFLQVNLPWSARLDGFCGYKRL